MRTRIAMVAVFFAIGTVAANDDGAFSGDIRAGYFNTWQTARNGEESRNDEYKMRFRLAAEKSFGDSLHGRIRLAGIQSSEQQGSDFYLRGYPSTRTGLAPGDATLDEAWVRFAPPGAGWSLRAGRMQTKFELAGLTAKSLDRNDGASLDVNWTDGLHLTGAGWLEGWNSHVILQHNHEQRASVTTRGPLDFSDSSSRVSLYAGLEAQKDYGPIIQRVIGFTFMPHALASGGIAQAEREHYAALDAKIAAGWPLSDSGRRFVAGIEVAYAFNTPGCTIIGTGDASKSDGLAWQIATSIHDIAPDHHVGVAVGRAGGGWLLSPDFRNNDALYEIRYQWKISDAWSMDARYRMREEVSAPVTALQQRQERDVFVRVTGKF
ncbi:MAG TPA: hypothetical protein VF275_04415 [Gammaproteobacteria bacterium]